MFQDGVAVLTSRPAGTTARNLLSVLDVVGSIHPIKEELPILVIHILWATDDPALTGHCDSS